MAGIRNFEQLNCDTMRGLKFAILVLIPRFEGAAKLTEFRPISLIHGFG